MSVQKEERKQLSIFLENGFCITWSTCWIHLDRRGFTCSFFMESYIGRRWACLVPSWCSCSCSICWWFTSPCWCWCWSSWWCCWSRWSTLVCRCPSYSSCSCPCVKPARCWTRCSSRLKSWKSVFQRLLVLLVQNQNVFWNLFSSGSLSLCLLNVAQQLFSKV